MITIPKLEWHGSATCAQIGGDMWFPGKSDREDVAACKKVCAACPVRRQCLEWAQETCESFGIWGGLTVLERRKLRRESEAA